MSARTVFGPERYITKSAACQEIVVRLRAKGEGLKERFFAFALGLYRNLKFFLPSPPFLKGDSWSLQAGKNFASRKESPPAPL